MLVNHCRPRTHLTHLHVQAEVKTLSRFPAMTFQLAASRPDSSLLAQATRQHRARGKELRPYLSFVNKPQHKNPCILVLPGTPATTHGEPRSRIHLSCVCVWHRHSI